MSDLQDNTFVEKILSAGGEVYVVGGWVRDRLRGAEPHDRDYVVTGLTEEAFCSLFPDAFCAGNSFPVYRLRIGGAHCEVAFARSEVKSGAGYRGFSVSFSPETTIEADLYRRDTTMNSVAIRLRDGEVVDPFGGIGDIEARIIRATSPHFVDDPVRALRAARQAAQFGFRIEEGTVELMRACREELALEPKERLLGELERALSSPAPSVFFRSLLDAGLLDVAYPQLYALVGRSQPPQWHPEGDAFEHTMEVVDRAVLLTDRIEVRFAALAHDLGKALTPDDELPSHHGHDELGLCALRAWNRKMTLPKRWMLCAAFAIREHMRANVITKTGRIVDLLNRLRRHPIGVDGLIAVIRADGKEPPAFLLESGRYYEAMDRVKGSDIPPELAGPARAAWLRERQCIEVAAMQKHANIVNCLRK